MRRAWIPLAFAVMGVCAWVIVQSQAGMVERDWFTYWAGGRGLLAGINLYDPRAWFDLHETYGSRWFPNPVFIYAPVTALFFAPLGALPVNIAAVLWVWFSEILTALSVWLIVRHWHHVRAMRLVLFWSLAVLFFLPALLTLLMGQASALILFLVAATAVLWQREKWFVGGLLLGLTTVKPQAVAFLILVIAVWLMLKRRWLALTGLGTALGASAVASVLLFPNFITDWLNTATGKVGGVAARMPTIWGLAADLSAPPFGVWLGVLSACALAGLALVIVARWQGDLLTLFGALIVISMVVTPYLWNYDQILLLLPLAIALTRWEQRGVAEWVIAFTLFVVDLVAWLFFGLAASRLRDNWSVCLPFLVGALLWLACQDRKFGRLGLLRFKVW